MKRNLLLYVAMLFLTGCANFAGINWDEEIKSTHWRGVRIGQPSTLFANSNDANRNFINQVYSISRPVVCQGRLITVTPLNAAGISKMNSEGCKGCHSEGGARPSLYAVLLYK